MNKLPDFDCYAELGVRKDAPRDDIARAHRRLARKYHPDSDHPPEVMEELADDPDRYARIEQAWEVLGDTDMRHAYDDARAALAIPPPSPALRYLQLLLSSDQSWGENWKALLGFLFTVYGHYNWETEHRVLVRSCGWLDWIQGHAWARYSAIALAALALVYFVISFIASF